MFVLVSFSEKQKLQGDYTPVFGTKHSGIVWATSISYDRLMVFKSNHEPIIAHIGYPDDPRNLSAKS